METVSNKNNCCSCKYNGLDTKTIAKLRLNPPGEFDYIEMICISRIFFKSLGSIRFTVYENKPCEKYKPKKFKPQENKK